MGQYYGERYFHGTPFRRAVEEGLLDPSRSLLAGMRGGVYDDGDVRMPGDLGFDVLSVDELVALSRAEYGARVRARVGEGPLFLSFDIDVLDPAFAPGTGTPEAGGVTTREALGYLRALAGLRFSGFDVVEVSPPYNGRASRRRLPRRTWPKRAADARRAGLSALRGLRLGDREQPLADRVLLAAEIVEPRQLGERVEREDPLEERRHAIADGAARAALATRLGDEPRSTSEATVESAATPRMRAISGRETGPR